MVKKNIKKTHETAVHTKLAKKGTAPKTLSSKTKPSKKTVVKTKTGGKSVQSRLSAKPAKTIKTEKIAASTKPKKVTASMPETNKQKTSPREKKILDIRKNLSQLKNSLLSEAEEALNSLPGQTVFPDLGDQASAEIDRSFMLRLRGREQRLLKKIEEAIEKIETGSFGICESCGHEIDIKRLEARPVTTMCIYCKTEQEEEEKVRGG
ncbi:MAG: TraR/DksA C4-type zinc finger protein [Thermodesulfovibrionales bacterium]|jgi:DnaK suppressor protein